MWAGGRAKKDGASVVIYQPIPRSRQEHGNKAISTLDPTLTFIGGAPSYFDDDEEKMRSMLPSLRPTCTLCTDELMLLLQLYAPLEEDVDGCGRLDRTLYVFGCNRASCRNHPGSFRCLRSQSVCYTTESTSTRSQKDLVSGEGDGNQEHEETKDLWSEKNSTNDDVNPWSWDDEEDKGNELDELNDMLSAYEMNENSRKRKDQGKQKEAQDLVNVKTDDDNFAVPHDDARKGSVARSCELSSSAKDGMVSFPRFELECFDEPSDANVVARAGAAADDIDDDEVGLASPEMQVGRSDEKSVEEMLKRYLSEEDDASLVETLRGATAGVADGRAGPSSPRDGSVESDAYEREERISPARRFFLAFTDRMKVAPRQVVRYAYGGEPMWSAPPQWLSSYARSTKERGSGLGHRDVLPTVPTCSCGETRKFEFQLMPTILHVLNVDGFSPERVRAVSQTDDGKRGRVAFGSDSGGMNWGVVAVYSCPESCESSREEYVIVQDPLDGTAGPTNDNGGDIVDKSMPDA